MIEKTVAGYPVGSAIESVMAYANVDWMLKLTVAPWTYVAARGPTDMSAAPTVNAAVALNCPSVVFATSVYAPRFKVGTVKVPVYIRLALTTGAGDTDSAALYVELVT